LEIVILRLGRLASAIKNTNLLWDAERPIYHAKRGGDDGTWTRIWKTMSRDFYKLSLVCLRI